jgi:hypothetical protein
MGIVITLIKIGCYTVGLGGVLVLAFGLAWLLGIVGLIPSYRADLWCDRLSDAIMAAAMTGMGFMIFAFLATFLL